MFTFPNQSSCGRTRHSSPVSADSAVCLSIVPASGMIYIQNECRDVIVGFLHTYGLSWTEETTKLNLVDTSGSIEVEEKL